MTARLPVTRIPAAGLPPLAVVVGAPQRATDLAGRLTDSEQLGENREYRTYQGLWRGTPVVVASHGVGGPGAICSFAELAEAGVRTFLRLGTAGSLRPEIVAGDLVIAEAAVRDDGVTQQLVPPEYPAFATAETVPALTKAARAHGVRHHRGVVWTRAAFSPGVLRLPMREYVDARVKAIEMELSALLVFAGLNGLAAGGALVIDGNAAGDDVGPSTYDPHREVVADGVRRSADVVLDALVDLGAADE